MGTPYTPPGTDPTGYPGRRPQNPTPANEVPVEPEPQDEPQEDDL